jgi:hypothetical protein
MHKRGGSSVLDIVDTTTDISAKDGTYTGGGIMYSKAANSLWCFTTLTEYTTSTAAYEIKFAPRSICRGADWTWTGNVQFDNTVFLKDNVDISGDVLCDGSLVVLMPSEFTSAVFDGSVDISQNLNCWSKAAFVNDISGNAGLSIDGTTTLFGNLKVAGDISFADISGTVKQRLCSAWGALNPSGASVLAGYNIASVKKEAVGDYSITFTTALSSANYAVVLTVRDGSANDIGGGLTACSVCQKTTGMRFTTGQSNEVSNSDVTGIAIVIFGG